MKSFTFSALAPGLCLSAFAQEPINSATVQKIRAEGLEKSKAMDIAFHITDVSGPRLSNSSGLKRAQDWAVKYMKEIGLNLSYDALDLPGFQFIQDPMDYNTRTHHSNMDTYDRLVEDDLKKPATFVASFVYHTSERAEKLPRKAMPMPTAPRQ